MSGPLLLEHLSALEVPRQSWKVVYSLPEVLLLVLCATLGGKEDFVEVVRRGRSKIISCVGSWPMSGAWALLLHALNETGQGQDSVQMTDSTIVRAHQHAAGTKKSGGSGRRS